MKKNLFQAKKSSAPGEGESVLGKEESVPGEEESVLGEEESVPGEEEPVLGGEEIIFLMIWGRCWVDLGMIFDDLGMTWR